MHHNTKKMVSVGKFVNDSPDDCSNYFKRNIVVVKVPSLFLLAQKLTKSDT